MTLVAPATRDTPAPEVEVLFEEARRRRHRRRMGWVLVVLLIIAATVVIVSQVGSKKSGPGQQTTAGPRTALSVGMPDKIVGWTADFRVVVVSTTNGNVERTLASNVSILAPGLPNISVSPNGMVFFESATPAPYNHAFDTGDQVFTVPISGGQVRDIGSGSDPQVSPDGRFLAFISPGPAGQAGEAPYLVPPVSIDIATLSPQGSITGIRTLPPGPLQVNQGVSDLAWSSDSNLLSFDLLEPSTNATTSWMLDVGQSVTSLAAAHQIRLHTVGLTWNGYWGRYRNGTPRASGPRVEVTDGLCG